MKSLPRLVGEPLERVEDESALSGKDLLLVDNIAQLSNERNFMACNVQKLRDFLGEATSNSKGLVGLGDEDDIKNGTDQRTLGDGTTIPLCAQPGAIKNVLDRVLGSGTWQYGNITTGTMSAGNISASSLTTSSSISASGTISTTSTSPSAINASSGTINGKFLKAIQAANIANNTIINDSGLTTSTITANATIQANSSLNVIGNTTCNGTLSVAGAATCNSSLTVNGNCIAPNLVKGWAAWHGSGWSKRENITLSGSTLICNGATWGIAFKADRSSLSSYNQFRLINGNSITNSEAETQNDKDEIVVFF